jgi:PAS domain S-box-containing protein
VKTSPTSIHPDSLQAALLDAVEQAVIATDLSGHVIYWNAFAERLYGWSAAEVTQIEANVGELLIPEGLEAIARDRRFMTETAR